MPFLRPPGLGLSARASSSMDHSSFREAVERCGRLASVLSAADRALLPRLCEIGKEFLHRKAVVFVEHSRDSPLLFHLQADATLGHVKVVHSAQYEGRTVRRTGTTRWHYFMMRGYLVMEDALGRNRVATIMRDPKPCSRENTWTLLGAVDDFFPLPRSLGHRGLLLNHYTFDGGIMSSLYRRLQQRSEEFYQRLDDPSDAASLRRQEITVGTVCGLHVAHNSMKWATYQHLDDVRSDLKTILSSLTVCVIASMTLSCISEACCVVSSGWSLRSLRGG